MNIRSVPIETTDKILTYTGCKKFDQAADLLATRLTPLVTSHTRPKRMLAQACNILVRHKIESPGYYTLYTLINREMNQEELSQTIKQGLTKEQKAFSHEGMLEYMYQDLEVVMFFIDASTRAVSRGLCKYE